MKTQSYVETISEIKPHENADKLELAYVRGWQTIIPKGLYKAGDKILFVEIDTLLPKREWNEFLFKGSDAKKEVYRVCNVKLRGQPSQGIVFPLSVIDGIEWEANPDIIDKALGIEKYEKPVPACLAGEVFGGFPTKYIHQTDETNLLSQPDLLKELDEGCELVATLKMDGSSGTYVVDGDDFLVCSRNLNLKPSDKNTFWKLARELDLNTKLNTLGNTVVIQGEVSGEGIQKNPMKIKGHKLFVFNIKVDGLWYSVDKIKETCDELGLHSVPTLFTTTNHSLEYLRDRASEATYGDGSPAEGIVFRTVVPQHTNILGKYWSGKIINPNYKD